MIKGLFFDLDGTLINTYEADFLAYRDAIRDVLGILIDNSKFKLTHGQEMLKKLESLAPGTTSDQARQIGIKKKLHYKKYLAATTPNTPLIEFMSSFVGHTEIVLVTSAKRENAMAVLKEHNLLDLFSEMIFGEDVSNAKPDPEPYLLALSRTGLNPNEALVFEDTDSGILSADAAGIAVIHVKKFSV